MSTGESPSNPDPRSNTRCDVLFLAWSLNSGGAERKCATLADEFSRRGYAVSILTLSPHTQNDYPVRDEVHRMTVNDSTEHSPSLFNRAKSVVRRLWCIRRVIQDQRPEVVISVGHVQGLLAAICGKKRTPHFVWTTSTTHCFNTNDMKFKLLRFFCSRNKVTLVAQTDAIQAEYRKVGFKNIITIPNPVITPLVAANRDPSERPIRIASVGRLVSEKSYEHLIDALALLKDVQVEWTCQLIGEGPLMGELQERCQSRGLGSRVEFTGWVKDIREALQQSDIFVLTSSAEGQPNALLEAMSESIPCITTDFTGGAARDLLGETGAGIVVPVGDTKAIAEAIASLLSDHDRRSALGAKGREVVSAFSVDRITTRWIDVLGLNQSNQS
jgi:glycosyltransferase involved in cell wall biosynthesis